MLRGLYLYPSSLSIYGNFFYLSQDQLPRPVIIPEKRFAAASSSTNGGITTAVADNDGVEDYDDEEDDGGDDDGEDGKYEDDMSGSSQAKGKRGRPRKHAPKIPLPPLYVFIREESHPLESCVSVT